jgi:hypothetical protein
MVQKIDGSGVEGLEVLIAQLPKFDRQLGFRAESEELTR